MQYIIEPKRKVIGLNRTVKRAVGDT